MPYGAIRQAEVSASQTIIDRIESRFGIRPDKRVADTVYGSGDNLVFNRLYDVIRKT